MKFVPPPPASSITAPLESTQIGLSQEPASHSSLSTQPLPDKTVRFQSTEVQAASISSLLHQTLACHVKSETCIDVIDDFD